MAEPFVPMDPFHAVNSPLPQSNKGAPPVVLAALHEQHDGIHDDGRGPHASSNERTIPGRTDNESLLQALRKAVRGHLSVLFRTMPALDCAVITMDIAGRLVDISGPSERVATIHRHTEEFKRILLPYAVNLGSAEVAATAQGEPAVASTKPESPQAFAGSSIGYAPILDKHRHPLGGIAVLRFAPEKDEFTQVLAHSVAIAVANDIDLESSRQDAECVLHSLLSHLDYHVIRVHANGVLETHHPVPLREPILLEMKKYSANEVDGDADVFFEDRLFHCNVRTLMDSAGGSMGRLAIFRDITDEKQMESHMRDADKFTVLASLAAGIAHEIRNPLTTAKGFLQLFAERQCDNPDRRYLDLTIHELNRISELVKDFMSLARPEHRLYGRVDLASLAQEVLQFLQPEALLRGITLACVDPAAELWVHADANQLKQVLINLVQNAMQACAPGGQVWLELHQRKNSVQLSVHDTGHGLTPEQLSKVFQPFFTTKSTGTGLGLPISKQIMKEHGGTIEVKSETGKGTAVFLDFPQISSPDE